jgi:hypothetical protein
MSLEERTQEIRSVLRGAVIGIDGFSLMPYGGERHGGLVLVRAPIRSLDENPNLALPALFKAMQSLVQEWPYEHWTDDEILDVQTRGYYRWRAEQKPISNPSHYSVATLKVSGEGVLAAQRVKSETLPALRMLHNPKIPFDLNEVTVQNLVTFLDVRWNNTTALFRVMDSMWLVNWWTNA